MIKNSTKMAILLALAVEESTKNLKLASAEWWHQLFYIEVVDSIFGIC